MTGSDRKAKIGSEVFRAWNSEKVGVNRKGCYSFTKEYSIQVNMSTAANMIAVNNFDINHQDYDAFRPSFGKEFVDPFLVELGLGEFDKASNKFKFDTDKVVIELAAGTGKFTKNLVDNGWGDDINKSNLIIVEPSKGMLQSLEKNFPTINKINIHNAASYKIPLADNSADSLIVAQGFHWFADSTSLKEIQRVLKPTGTLGLIWNGDCASKVQDILVANAKFYDIGSRYYSEMINKPYTNTYDLFNDYFNKQPWSKQSADYIYTFDSEVPQYRKIDWKQFLASKENSYFDLLLTEQFAFYDIELPKDGVYNYWATRSYITNLSVDERKVVEQRVNSLLDQYVDDDSYSQNRKLIKPMITHAIALKSTKE